MKIALSAIVLTVFSSWAYADDYKVYWRCLDGHLEAMEAHAKLNGEETPLYIHYQSTKQPAWQSTPISLRSLASLPVNTQNGDFVVLGNKKQWLLNCVGEVHHNPVYHHGNVIFSVTRNAYSCPLIPPECQAKPVSQ
ncbi:hypothetical protein GH742_10000 [Legionella sp. MW5194]|uniref:hypothetical protein n=1 Tax=Legionella sp. MW5194 TaxID=2662448 RepID=UPI00193E258E|nr:hypothetical protein [Legionella sp. MW5194]QRN04178.1 hypothetical protein GH742_10000 [Legionella sp. MW5194]